MFTLILLIAAAILFLVAAFGVHAGRVHLGWLGAALATVALLAGNLPGGLD